MARLLPRPLTFLVLTLLAIGIIVYRLTRKVKPEGLIDIAEDLAAAHSQNLSPSLVGKHTGEDIPNEQEIEDEIKLPSDLKAANASAAKLSLQQRKKKKQNKAGKGGGAAAPDELCFNVEGYRGCGYFNAAVKLGEKAEAELGVFGTRRHSARRPDGSPFPPVRLLASAYHRNQWAERLPELRKEIEGGEGHRTSPMIYMGCSDSDFKYVGGGFGVAFEIVRSS